MRIVAVLFLSLCFLLLKGANPVYAGVRHNNISHISDQYIQKAQQIKLGNANLDISIIKNDNLTDKKEDFIGINDEDDDFVSSRKHILLVKYFTTLAYACVLIHFYNYLKNRLPSCKHLSYTSSYKYILQRVLRI